MLEPPSVPFLVQHVIVNRWRLIGHLEHWEREARLEALWLGLSVGYSAGVRPGESPREAGSSVTCLDHSSLSVHFCLPSSQTFWESDLWFCNLPTHQRTPQRTAIKGYSGEGENLREREQRADLLHRPHKSLGGKVARRDLFVCWGHSVNAAY